MLGATIVLQRKNLHELPGVVDLAAKLGVRLLNVNGLEPYDASLTGEALWIGDEVADLARVVEQCRPGSDPTRHSTTFSFPGAAGGSLPADGTTHHPG